MNDTASKGSIELLANGQFIEQWMPEGPSGKWEINSAGELVQKAIIGNRQGGTGTITAKKTPISAPVFEIKLTCRPGSQYQSGIVFNFVDEHNFSVFCIDQHNKESEGYDLLVFAVSNGDYDVISKQSYKETITGGVSFTLRQIGPDLFLLFNDTPSYVWTNRLLSGKRIGVYSYKNGDATFLSLSQNPFSITTPNIKTRPIDEQITKVNEQPVQQPVNTIPVNEITNFLGIRQPASKTEVEFTEVFTVPLDSFYSSLYQNTNLDKSNQTGTSDASEVETLDLRVRRWYRDLKIIRENIAFNKLDITRTEIRAKDSERQLSELPVNNDDGQYEALEKKLLDRRTDYRAAVRSMNGLRDQEGLLLREIRINGYEIVEGTTIEAIQNLGYDFHIISQSVAPSSYMPVKFPMNMNLSNDEKWTEVEQQLYHQLFDSGTITEKGKLLYESERPQLTTFNANPTLVEKINQLEMECNSLEELRTIYEAAVQDAEQLLSEWEKDRELLTQHKTDGYYTPGDSFETTLDDANHTVGGMVNDWGHELKHFNRFITGCVWEVQEGDRYSKEEGRGGRIYTELDIQCQDDSGADFSFSYVVEAEWGYNWNEEGRDETEDMRWHEGYWGETEMQRSVSMSPRGSSFHTVAMDLCDHFTDLAKIDIESAKGKLRELDAKNDVHREMLYDLQTNGLARERAKFIEKWNDPATNKTAPTLSHVHHPDDDPLAEFLASTSGHNAEHPNPVETYFFTPTPDGFYNQNGLSLQEFMNNRSASAIDADVICVFPVFDSMGRLSNEMIKSVRNPQKPSLNNTPSLPTIQFVESYRMEVGWLGYGLGELSHSFNLFPGEAKELVVEKSTKLSTKLSQTSTSEESVSTHVTSSFEDNLKNEFSVGEKAAQDISTASKNDASKSGSTEDASSSESSSSSAASIQANVSGGIFGFNASVSGGSNSNSSSRNTTSSKRNSAFAASQSAEEKRASNQSKDVLAKNVSNVVRKVASDTSQNNKLSFTAVSSREYEESATNRETIKLQNPNVGKTVNYNFFQLQNQFGITVKLVDVQIVIDSGVEMVKGTDINDVRVHSLEEFGKIFANSDGSDRAAALAAIVTRQVMKHYGNFLPGVTSGSGTIGIREGFTIDKNSIEVLNFSSEEKSTENSTDTAKTRIDRIKTALSYLKSVPFQFYEKTLSEETTVSVNCAAYHVEAQLGFLPATEAYLENRREIETDKQRALVEHVKAQTKAGVFFQELPEGVTSLNLAVPKSDKQKENPV